jgi:putative spermidine/putrescine transport system ATP-binding protein
MTEVAIRALVKRYQGFTAVNGISVTVRPGEFVSLLGPSGCGKTTTLKCIAGFESADAGSILFDGADVSRLPPERRDIGMVFQSYALFPHLTVKRNLAFGLEMRHVGRTEIAARVASVLDLVQLGGLGERYPRELSGGQQQRVALARALVIEPRILLLDEPLANLDAKLRDEMRTFIRDLQRRVGITTVYVTHDQAEAMTMSDRIVVMFKGRIAQVAEPETLYHRPADAEVARFVGRANIFTGTVVAGADGSLLIETATGRLRAPPGFARPAGAETRLIVRPEAVSLAPCGPTVGSAPSGIRGRIVGRYFHGAHVDYHVLAGEQTWTVQSAAGPLFADGAEVALTFDPERLWDVGEAQ